jgi:hypothetical protein
METTELKTFKFLSEDTIALDGLIWGTDVEKRIEVEDTRTGGKVDSIKVHGNHYYPIAIDNRKKK